MTEEICPFLDANDARCSPRFSLQKLGDMFELCAGGGQCRCVMYHRLRMEQEQGPLVNTVSPPSPSPVLMTCNGTDLELRPTGS